MVLSHGLHPIAPSGTHIRAERSSLAGRLPELNLAPPNKRMQATRLRRDGSDGDWKPC
jgi:hypothetical protein